MARVFVVLAILLGVVGVRSIGCGWRELLLMLLGWGVVVVLVIFHSIDF